MPFIPGLGAAPSVAPVLPALQGSRQLAGQEFADFSGGLVAVGSAYYDETPRWESVAPFSIGTTTVPKGLYLEGAGKPVEGEFLDHPATQVSWEGFAKYYRLVNARLGSPVVGFPTSLEWTVGASPVVDVRKLMEEKGIRPGDLAEAADEWLERFFTEPGGTIYTDLRGEAFQRVLASSAPLLAYYVYGTESGKLGGPAEEAWYGQSGTAPVNWGRPNKHGLYGVTGGVWELVGDGTERRGGSWLNDSRRYLWVVHRNQGHYPHSGRDYLGSRPSALPQNPLF